MAAINTDNPIIREFYYSSSNLFINDLHAGEKILLIDDVVSTGGTLIALLKTLKDLGLEVKSTVAVIDKGKGKEIVERETGVNVFSIVKVNIIDGKVIILYVWRGI